MGLSSSPPLLHHRPSDNYHTLPNHFSSLLACCFPGNERGDWFQLLRCFNWQVEIPQSHLQDTVYEEAKGQLKRQGRQLLRYQFRNFTKICLVNKGGLNVLAIFTMLSALCLQRSNFLWTQDKAAQYWGLTPCACKQLTPTRACCGS